MLAPMPPPPNCLPPYQYDPLVYISVDIFEIGVAHNSNTDKPTKAIVSFGSSTHPERVDSDGNINLTGIKGCVNITYTLQPQFIHLSFNDPPIRTWVNPKKPLISIFPDDFDNISQINISSNQSFNGWYHNPSPNNDTFRYYTIFLVGSGKECQSRKYNYCEKDPIYHNGDGKQAPERNILEEFLDGLKFLFSYFTDIITSLVGVNI